MRDPPGPGPGPAPRVSHDLFGVRLLHTRPISDRTRLVTGLGYHYDRYFRERSVGASGGGPGALLGVRVDLTGALALRLDAGAYRVGSDPDRAIPRPTTLNRTLQAGLSYTFRDRTRVIELPPPPPDTVLVHPPHRRLPR